MQNDELKQLLELLGQAEEADRKKELLDPTNIPRNTISAYTIKSFINQFNIKPGLKRVHNYIIYFYYINKLTQHRANKVNKLAFFREFSKFFPRARVGSQRYYLLDESVFDVSKEVKREAKVFDLNYRFRSNVMRNSRKKKKLNEKEKNNT